MFCCVHLFNYLFIHVSGMGTRRWGGVWKRRVARGAVLKRKEKRETSLTESTHKDII